MSFLSAEALDVNGLLAEVSAPGRGGIAVFIGLVRDHQAGRRVERLGYSAYAPMAELVSAEIVAEAERRWPVRVGLRHRLGDLGIGEAAVAVAVAGAHRDEAFAACRYVIEEVKRRVPIWKRERYADGTEEWVDPTRQEIARSEERDQEVASSEKRGQEVASSEKREGSAVW
ncbi:MAG TPA: molybdenum cofactor biosynthesis protein MoaE [Gemmatimonadales bacterium]|nr:molybdenum cofactor biosynthesis protein MoaE [Gemmatimonadales bacterium]